MIKKYALAFIIATSMFISCSNNKDSADQENRARKAFLEKVKTIKSELSNQRQELTLGGKVEYDPDKVVSFSSLTSGIVDRAYFSLGDKVQRGQIMVDMRSSELNTLQSDKISLEAEAKIAQRELETAQSMFNDGMLSEKELLEAQGKLKQAQAELNKVENDMLIYGTNKANGSFSIKAPMSGYVVEKNATSGTTVSEGSEPLFIIADLSTVWIMVNVYAGNLKFVREGMDVEITSLSYPGEIFSGKISSISQVFDPEEKVLKARIVMRNEGLKFKPEMSVMVNLKDENNSKCVSIPSDALIFDNDRNYVVVEPEAGNFKIKEVLLQGHNGKTTYIASGLDEGENVVVKNQLLIYSDLKGI